MKKVTTIIKQKIIMIIMTIIKIKVIAIARIIVKKKELQHRYYMN